MVDQRDIISTGLVFVVDLGVGIVGCLDTGEVALPDLVVLREELGDLFLAGLGYY